VIVFGGGIGVRFGAEIGRRVLVGIRPGDKRRVEAQLFASPAAPSAAGRSYPEKASRPSAGMYAFMRGTQAGRLGEQASGENWRWGAAGWIGRGESSTCHYGNGISSNMTDGMVSSQRRSPDPEKCRTRYLGKPLGFTKCLLENPDDCEFAVRFSSGVSCFHPDRRSFDRTQPPEK
jgi:hypothetical protein